MNVSSLTVSVRNTVTAVVVALVAVTCLGSAAAAGAGHHSGASVTGATKEWKAARPTTDVTLATKEWKSVTTATPLTKEW
jgi:hypothetical protein